MTESGERASPDETAADGSASEPTGPPPPPPPPSPPAQHLPNESTATGAMVTAIFGILMDVALPIGGIALGVVALIMARGASRRIAASNGTLGGQQRVKAARILAVVSIVGAFIAAAIYASVYDSQN